MQVRALLAHFEQFVDLLLVLDDGDANVGVEQHEHHFLGHGILVQRHRHATEDLRGAHRPVQPRPVVADDGQAVAALEAEFRQPAGQRGHLVRNLGPGPALPDAHVLLAHGRRVGKRARVVRQQTRKGVERGSLRRGRFRCSRHRNLLLPAACGKGRAV